MAAMDRRLFYHFDWPLALCVLGLVGIGMLSLLSASYQPYHPLHPVVARQLIWVGAGLAAVIAAVLFDYRALSTYAYPFYGLTLILLAAVAIAGHSTMGARRWLDLGFFKLEPSEVAKLAIVLVMARYMREDPPGGGLRLHQLILPALLVSVPAALVLSQPDLGTALVLILVAGTLIFVGGMNLRVLLAIVIAIALAAPVGWRFMKPYQRQRLATFVDPQVDPLGAGYHVIQSEIAIGSGGPWGKGFLRGTQARLNFLPEQSTDFIFAVFAEEWGFLGTLVVFGLYVGLITRGLWIARHARDRFGALLAAGTTSIILWQVLINVGMAAGVLPVVGITLPLFSYGGSSLIAMMAAMGILISINTRRYLF